MNHAQLSGLCALMLAATGPALAQGAFVYTSIPFAANAVDGSNRVVGYAAKSFSGAVWVNGTTTLVPLSTDLQAVNSNGLAAGFVEVGKKATASFVTYDIGSGVTTTYKAPKGAKGDFFAVGGINNAGVAVADLDAKKYSAQPGFIISGGVFTPVRYTKNDLTHTFGINDSGVVTGSYRDSAQIYHSYTLQGGVFTTFDPPGVAGSAGTGTTDSGVTYGQFTDSSGNNNGYLMSGGVFTTVQYPGAPITVVTGIGPGNEVVGFYRGSDNSAYGFVLVNGTYYQVTPEGYFIYGVNALGSIVGWTSTNGSGGFIATCAADQFPCTH